LPVTTTHLGLWRHGQDLLQYGQALGGIGRVGREPQVQRDQLRQVPPDLRHGAASVLGLKYLVPFETPPQLALQTLVVLDDE